MVAQIKRVLASHWWQTERLVRLRAADVGFPLDRLNPEVAARYRCVSVCVCARE